jgi:hypothetical protein
VVTPENYRTILDLSWVDLRLSVVTDGVESAANMLCDAIYAYSTGVRGVDRRNTPLAKISGVRLELHNFLGVPRKDNGRLLKSELLEFLAVGLNKTKTETQVNGTLPEMTASRLRARLGSICWC